MMKNRDFSAFSRPVSVPVLALMATLALSLGACAGSQKQRAELSEREKARLLVDVGYGALLEADMVGALRSFTEARQLDPELPEIYHGIALVYHTRRNFPLSLENVKKAIELQPKYTDAYNTLGKILIDLGRHKEAEAPLLKAANDPLNRDAHKAHTNLGILYYRTGQEAKAETHFSKAAGQVGAGSACIAHYYLGHLHLKRGDFKNATREYDRATRHLCASFSDAHLALGIAYKRGNQFDLARKKFLEISQTFAGTQVADQAMKHLQEIP